MVDQLGDDFARSAVGCLHGGWTVWWQTGTGGIDKASVAVTVIEGCRKAEQVECILWAVALLTSIDGLRFPAAGQG
jgi:hypothetical protein